MFEPYLGQKVVCGCLVAAPPRLITATISHWTRHRKNISFPYSENNINCLLLQVLLDPKQEISRWLKELGDGYRHHKEHRKSVDIIYTTSMVTILDTGQSSGSFELARAYLGIDFK